MYIHAFDRMLAERERRGMPILEKFGTSGEEVFAWWTGEDKDQIGFNFDDEAFQITVEDFERGIDV